MVLWGIVNVLRTIGDLRWLSSLQTTRHPSIITHFINGTQMIEIPYVLCRCQDKGGNCENIANDDSLNSCQFLGFIIYILVLFQSQKESRVYGSANIMSVSVGMATTKSGGPIDGARDSPNLKSQFRQLSRVRTQCLRVLTDARLIIVMVSQITGNSIISTFFFSTDHTENIRLPF